MTKDQILLKKAIEKAVENGFNPIEDMGKVHKIEPMPQARGVWFYTKIGDGGWYELERLLFGLNHSFAKAFFKEYEEHSTFEQYQSSKTWKHYLQEMVLEEQPLKYLERFL